MARILVVEDDPVSLRIVSKALEHDGHTVTAHHRARDALATLAAAPFDVLVTDIMMPDEDGFTMIQAARGLRPDIRVIVLSAIDERVPHDLSAQAFDRLGVDRVLSKPIRRVPLRDAVEAVMGQEE